MKEIVIGSRGSQLALQQARLIQEEIQRLHAERAARIEIIRTSGDKMPQPPPQGTESVKGLFVKEIEEALLDGHIDLAVHSLKDLPADLPKGLCLGAIPEREDPRDVLITNSNVRSLDDLPHGAQLGTSSLRRRVQLRHLRPDIQVRPIRGNVDTRIRKIRRHDLDGIVLAAAALRRLGLEDRIAYMFSVEEMVPAVGQGALAVEIRSDDVAAREVVEALNHPASYRCALAERRFLSTMEGDCQVPMGGHACIREGKGVFFAFVASPSGPQVVSRVIEGSQEDLEQLADEAAAYLLSNGARAIFDELDAMA